MCNYVLYINRYGSNFLHTQFQAFDAIKKVLEAEWNVQQLR